MGTKILVSKVACTRIPSPTSVVLVYPRRTTYGRIRISRVYEQGVGTIFFSPEATDVYKCHPVLAERMRAACVRYEKKGSVVAPSESSNVC